MERTPEAPKLIRSRPLGRAIALNLIFWPLTIWVSFQLLFFTFWGFGWLGDQFVAPGTSEFLYGGYQDVWDTYKHRYLPDWFFAIPTWRDAWTWPLFPLVLYYRMGGRFTWLLILIVPFHALWIYARVKFARYSYPNPDLHYHPQSNNFNLGENEDDAQDQSDFGFDEQTFRRDKTSSPPPKDGPFENALELFELKPGYDEEELKKRRKQLLAKTHPDAGGSTMLFKQVEKAFELLKARLPT